MLEPISHTINTTKRIIPTKPDDNLNTLMELDLYNFKLDFLPLPNGLKLNLSDQTKQELGLSDQLICKKLSYKDKEVLIFGFTNSKTVLNYNDAISTIAIDGSGNTVRIASIRDNSIIACNYQYDPETNKYFLAHAMVSSPDKNIGMPLPKLNNDAVLPYYAAFMTTHMREICPHRLISVRSNDGITYMCDEFEDGFRAHTHGDQVFIANSDSFNFPLPRTI